MKAPLIYCPISHFLAESKACKQSSSVLHVTPSGWWLSCKEASNRQCKWRSTPGHLMYAFATSTDSKPLSFLTIEAGSFITPSRNPDSYHRKNILCPQRIDWHGWPARLSLLLLPSPTSLTFQASLGCSDGSGTFRSTKTDPVPFVTYFTWQAVSSCHTWLVNECLWCGLLKVWMSYKMGLNGYICNILANYAYSFVLRQLFPTTATCIKT